MVLRMSRVGQNRIYTPYMTVHLMRSLQKIPYIHHMYMVLANPTYVFFLFTILNIGPSLAFVVSSEYGPVFRLFFVFRMVIAM